MFAFIPAVGACRPDFQELESELTKNSVVYCDSRDACNKEAGDIILSGVSLPTRSISDCVKS